MEELQGHGLCLIMSECTERGACVNLLRIIREIDIKSMSDNRFTAELKNVVFDQVTVHDSLSIPVEGGDQWCINDFTIDEEYVRRFQPAETPMGRVEFPRNVRVQILPVWVRLRRLFPTIVERVNRSA